MSVRRLLSGGPIWIRSDVWRWASGGGNACLRTGIPAADNPLEAARHLAAAATAVLPPEAAGMEVLLKAVLLPAAAATAVLLPEAAAMALRLPAVTAVLLPAVTAVLLPVVTAAG
jgi:hypothetical protein